MTSSASDDWSYYQLRCGVDEFEKLIRKINRLATCKLAAKDLTDSLRHTIDFIEYNMNEMEINGGNGD